MNIDRNVSAFEATPDEPVTALTGLKAALTRFDRDMPVRMLIALTQSGKHIYAGTVPGAVIAQRRAKNKVARKQRRVNRLRGA